jgi:predicted transcriptional regulator
MFKPLREPMTRAKLIPSELIAMINSDGRSAMQTRVLTAHVPLPLAKELDRAAARMDRSRGWILTQALSEWLRVEEHRRQLTLEAMADVDAGRLIDHREIKAWVQSLGARKTNKR